MNIRWLTFLGVILFSAFAHAADPQFEVKHQPLQPKSGQAVVVRVQSKAAAPAEGLVLLYQTVDPGKYIAQKDGAFEKEWTSVTMKESGGVWTVEVPGEVQHHRRLVRYRIVSGKDKKRLAPEADDTQGNFAYFCYDGVPDWKGAINPNGRDPKLREVVTYPSAQLTKVPVYHFISHRKSVENVTWNEQKDWGPGSNRNDYNYTGTLVYDGEVYDHVEFRARGGEWRHAMGKNMWKFNFYDGHRFEAKDNFGKPYQAKWDKLNLGACISQGDTGLRGEQGMLEAVGFHLFNLAGIEAPRTHWVHLRIIDEAEESPRDQYSGDFWGLYLAVENIDGHFLKEHKLPKGNVYKMEPWGPKLEYNGNPAVTNLSDVNLFSRNLRPQQPEAWWQQNIDLQRYFSYRSILECIHHYDIQSGKNYFYYHNLASKRWIVLPWDIDLSWSDNAYGSGHEPFYRAGLTQRPPFRAQYQDRLAEIRDLLFNPDQLNMLIDEFTAVISAPEGMPSIALADRAKWDFNPALVGRGTFSNKAGHGKFYFGDPKYSFNTMGEYMKQYAERRLRFIDGNLLSGHQPPPAPKIVSTGATQFRAESASETPVLWRLAEVSDAKGPNFNAKEPRKYEINSLWEKQMPAGQAPMIPAELLELGRTYRVRARQQDASGRWSRWSKPAQFTAGK